MSLWHFVSCNLFLSLALFQNKTKKKVYVGIIALFKLEVYYYQYDVIKWIK